MAERKQPPQEVVEASQKVDEFRDVSATRLARIKGDSEDSPTRAAAAVAMKIDGAGYTDIAKVLDYSSAQRARQAVEEAISLQAGSPEEIDHIRFINSRRIERILTSVMTRATDPGDPDHLAYARMAVVLVDRHLRLWGADNPAQMKVTVTPTALAIEEWVTQMARQTYGVADEADILDAEVIEDTDDRDTEEGEL